MPDAALSPSTSFSRLLLSQDQDQPQLPLLDVTDQNQPNQKIKKVKKTRLLLDARTELTDDELKVCWLWFWYWHRPQNWLGGARAVPTGPKHIEA